MVMVYKKRRADTLTQNYWHIQKRSLHPVAATLPFETARMAWRHTSTDYRTKVKKALSENFQRCRLLPLGTPHCLKVVSLTRCLTLAIPCDDSCPLPLKKRLYRHGRDSNTLRDASVSR